MSVEGEVVVRPVRRPAVRNPGDLPRHQLYMTLKDRWIQVREARNPTTSGVGKGRGRGGGSHVGALADMLSSALGRNVDYARVSTWATATDTGAHGHAPPPWDVIRWLMFELKLDLVVPGRGAPYFVPAKGSA